MFESILQEIILPLIRNMRDIRRYTVAIRETIESLHGTVALADLLGIEAIRVFLRDVFDRLPAVVDVLTDEPTSDIITEEGGIDLLRTGQSRTPAVDDLVAAADTHRESVESMLRILFPRVRSVDDRSPIFRYDSERLCHESRISCRAIMRLYLERFRGGELLAHGDAERALRCMNDISSLKTLFHDEVSPTMWRHIVAYLIGFPTEKFVKEYIGSACIVFWNLLDDERLDDSNYGSLIRVVRRATMQLSNVYGSDVKGRDQMLIQVMSQLRTLSTRVLFVGFVAHTDERLRATSESSASELKRRLHTEVRSAGVDTLLQQRDLTVIFESGRDLLQGLQPIMIPDSPALTLTLVLHANHIWDRLERMFGGKAVLVEKIRDLLSRRDEVIPWIERQGISEEEANRELRLLQAWLKSNDDIERDR